MRPSGEELAWRLLACSSEKEPNMNSLNVIPDPEARVFIAVPVAEEQIEVEWPSVLDCGALGPSREEPELFYQGVDDWEIH